MKLYALNLKTNLKTLRKLMMALKFRNLTG